MNTTVFTPQKAVALPVPDIAIDTGTIRSRSAGDIYFSADGGEEEARHVFLGGNYLPARWMGRLRFSIGEVGFGAGLNFLTTWRTFEDTVPDPDARLFYISTEREPFTPEQLTAALAAYPDYAEYTAHLIARYPIRVPGWHRIAFDRVVLWLGYGDSHDLLRDFQGEIDAWYLDGFSPAKNPDAWNEPIFDEIIRLSAPDATCATFSAAANVKYQMQRAGFAIEKIAGFGKKRDMLRGMRHHFRERFSISVPQVAVIGAGIAGASAAHALAERGAQVSLFDAAEAAHGASGNPAAVFYPRLGKHYSDDVAESFLSYAHGLREITRLGGYKNGWAHQPGMLKYPKSPDERARLYAVNSALGIDPQVAQWCTYEQAASRTGIELADGGVWFNHGTWLRPRNYTEQFADHGRVRFNEAVRVENVEHYGEGFLLNLEHGACAATHVVFANAAACLGYSMCEHLPLRISAGQISLLPTEHVRTPLNSIFCHRGYTIPCDDAYVIGATYDHDDIGLNLRDENHHHNLATLMRYAPNMIHGKPKLTEGRISHRVGTPSRTPLIGALLDANGAQVAGAYTSLGHASRGMLSAPYGAEIIAAQIYNEPRPLSWK